MKTPEEIKADAATCLTRPQHSSCNRFALYKECNGDCGYIIKELYDLVLQLESSLAQAERERDAAVEDMRTAFRKCNVCFSCKYDAGENNECMDCIGSCNWEWRGVREENTHDQP